MLEFERTLAQTLYAQRLRCTQSTSVVDEKYSLLIAGFAFALTVLHENGDEPFLG